MNNLTNKIALVTGASRGIGAAIAKRLAREGATVIINYTQSVERAEAVMQAIETEGGKAVTLQADLSVVLEIRRLFEEIIKRFGHLDILVNNAGIALMAPLRDVSEADFERMFALNVRGTFFAMQEAARHMADGGRIINISTSSTVFPFPNTAAYAGSKGAIDQFTFIAAKEFGERGITVNAIAPGGTQSESFRELVPAEFKEFIKNSSPLGRIGEPEDIADVVAFLASNEARWITGQKILVNGGAAI